MMTRLFWILVAYMLLVMSCTSAYRSAHNESVITEHRTLDTIVVSAPAALDIAPDDLEDGLGNHAQTYRPSYDRDIDLLHTALDLSFDWALEKVYGVATLKIKPHFYPIEKFRLDAKKLAIKSIKIMPSGRELSFDYDSTSLHVQLDKEYKRQDTIAIEIAYSAVPKEEAQGSAILSDKGLFFINAQKEDPNKPQQIWTQGQTENNSRWFPTVDRPIERSTQEVRLTVDKKFVTLSNGVLVSSEAISPDLRIDHWVLDQPHAPYLFMLAIGEFAMVEEEWKDRGLLYVVEPEYADHAKKIFAHTPEMLSFFSDYTGYEYPWPKYAQVVVRDYVSGAMENTTSVIFGEFVQRYSRDLMDHDNDDIVSHEMFHHWFGDLVTCESWSNLTLNEGFATYAEYLWQEYKYGSDAASMKLETDRTIYLQDAVLGEVHPLIRYMYRHRDDLFDSHSYNKGGAVLHMLRSLVGDEAFRASLNRYLTDNEYKSVEVHDLRIAFEEVTGRDLSWFFDQWFLSSGHPILTIDHHYDPVEKAIVLQVEQRVVGAQKNGVFRLDTELGVYDASGKQHLYPVTIDELQEELTIPVSFTPIVINFDPQRVLISQEIESHSEKELSYIARYGGNAAERIHALEQIMDEVSDDPVFVSALLADTSDYVLSRVLDLLPHSTMIAHQNRLIQIAHTTQMASLKAKVLSELSATGAINDEVVEMSKNILAKNEDSYATMASAYDVLVKVEPASARIYLPTIKNLKSASGATAVTRYYTLSGDQDDEFVLSSIGIMDGHSVWSFSDVLTQYVEDAEDPKSLTKQVLDAYASSSNVYSRIVVAMTAGRLMNQYRKDDNFVSYCREILKKMYAVEPYAELKDIYRQAMQ